MFPMLSIWNPRLINPSVAVIFRQSFKVKQLTPISSYHHFLRNEDETAKRKTGFGLTKHNLLFNICKTIHSNEALFKNLNSPGQKIVVEKQKAEKLEKHEVTIDALEEGKQLGLFARFKKMAKDYWYVFIPVHVTTSFCWLGAFYYTSTR